MRVHLLDRDLHDRSQLARIAFPEEAQHGFFAGGRCYQLLLGPLNPMGNAVRAPGGFRSEQALPFRQRGFANAGRWVFAMGLVQGEDPPPPRWFAIPARGSRRRHRPRARRRACTGTAQQLDVSRCRKCSCRSIARSIWADVWSMQLARDRSCRSNPVYRMPPVRLSGVLHVDPRRSRRFGG